MGILSEIKTYNSIFNLGYVGAMFKYYFYRVMIRIRHQLKSIEFTDEINENIIEELIRNDILVIPNDDQDITVDIMSLDEFLSGTIEYIYSNMKDTISSYTHVDEVKTYMTPYLIYISIPKPLIEWFEIPYPRFKTVITLSVPNLKIHIGYYSIEYIYGLIFGYIQNVLKPEIIDNPDTGKKSVTFTQDNDRLFSVKINGKYMDYDKLLAVVIIFNNYSEQPDNKHVLYTYKNGIYTQMIITEDYIEGYQVYGSD